MIPKGFCLTCYGTRQVSFGLALRKELAQVAAVAMAWIECIDRRDGREAV